MVNYASAFSQSESGKYFEWIITDGSEILIFILRFLACFIWSVPTGVSVRWNRSRHCVPRRKVKFFLVIYIFYLLIGGRSHSCILIYFYASAFLKVPRFVCNHPIDKICPRTDPHWVLESKRWSRDQVQPGVSTRRQGRTNAHVLQCYSYCSCQCRKKKILIINFWVPVIL